MKNKPEIKEALEEGVIDTMALYGINTFKTDKRMKEPKLENL